MPAPSFSSDTADETVSKRKPRPARTVNVLRRVWDRYIAYPDADPRDEQLFHSYANLRSADGTRALCMFLLVGTLVVWPFDLLLFAQQPRMITALVMGRTSLLALTTLAVFLL